MKKLLPGDLNFWNGECDQTIYISHPRVFMFHKSSQFEDGQGELMRKKNLIVLNLNVHILLELRFKLNFSVGWTELTFWPCCT